MSCECMKRSKAEMTYDQLNAANNSACNNLAICKEKLFKRRAETTRLRQQLDIAVGALEAMSEDGFKIEYTRGKCKHGQYDFESCNQCYEEYAAQALAQIRELEK